MLGLVTTKKPRLESSDELRRRIEEAARLIPLERLALSPQCGFASTMEGNRISLDDQRRKLELGGNDGAGGMGVIKIGISPHQLMGSYPCWA